MNWTIWFEIIKTCIYMLPLHHLWHLNSIGIKIQQKHVMKSLAPVDHTSSNIWWLLTVRRKRYNFQKSLTRWSFVLHEAIDNYPRLMAFLQCSTNNKSETTITLFDFALRMYGLASRGKTDDKGEENILLWKKW